MKGDVRPFDQSYSSAGGEKVRVLHLIVGLEAGGAEWTLCRLLERIDRSRFDSCVISLTGIGEPGRRIRLAGHSIIELGARRGNADPRLICRLINIILSVRPDVLQTWMYHSDLLGLIAGRFCRVPRIYWNIRRSAPRREDRARHWGWMLRTLALVSPLADGIVSNSISGMKAHQELGYRSRRWIHIPNGFDPEVLRPSHDAGELLRRRLGISHGSPTIGFLGRFHPIKGHRYFLEAVSSTLDAMPDLVVLMGGKGVTHENTDLTEMMRHLGVSDNVFLLGEIVETKAFYSAVDVLVSASIGEGFPNVIAEAMASAIPVIATDVGDAAAIVDDPERIVPARDPLALAAAIRSHFSLSSGERAALGRASRRRIETHYGIETMVERYETLYAEK